MLHEDLAPAGYNVASDVEFTISDTGEVQKVVMKDEAKPVVVKLEMIVILSFYITMGIVCFRFDRMFICKKKIWRKE